MSMAAPFGAEAKPSDIKALARSLQEVLRSEKPGDQVALTIIDVLTGQMLLANKNADRAFGPASNMKLLTSAVTLDRLGPDAVLTTTLAVSGNDLLVIGSGDPALGDPALAKRAGRTPMSLFDDWAAALRKAGIVKITGDVVVVDTVFDAQFTHPTWGPGNIRQWYGAPVAGVNFNDNCVDFTFVPGEIGQPAEVKTLPPAGGFVVKGSVKTTGDTKKHSPVLDKSKRSVGGKPLYTVSGLLANKAGPYSKPVDDPNLFFGETLKAALAERGVEVMGGVRVLRDAAEAKALKTRWIAEHQTKLTDVLGRVNTNSQNMMAEALAKLNGLAYDLDHGTPPDEARGSWASGHAAAIEFLKSIDLDTVAVVSADGSGLSRKNRLSARVLAELLGHMLADHQHGETYLNSMAISGVRGSLRNRMKTLKGRVYAKTGTINGVSALSGYVFAKNGNVVAFSIVHNGKTLGSSSARTQQNKAVLAIAAWLEKQPAVEIDDPEVIEAMQLVGLR